MQAENCTWMLWSIDSCQKRVSADRYHLAVSRAQVSTHRGRVFLKLSADKLLVFKWSQAQVCFFKILYEICRVYVTMAQHRSRLNLPRTGKFSQLFKNTGGEDLFMNIACRSTQNVARIKRFSRLHIVIKPLNKKKINIINSLLCWSVTLLMFIHTLDRLSKVRTGWPYRWFWKFFERFR